MQMLLSQQVKDSLLEGTNRLDDVVVATQSQPVAQVIDGEIYLYSPKFFEDFATDPFAVAYPVVKDGKYQLMITSDEDMFIVTPTLGGWRIEGLDPSDHETVQVSWTESFTLG